MGYLLAIDPGQLEKTSGMVIVDDLWYEGLGYRVVASGEPSTKDLIRFVKSGYVEILFCDGLVREEAIKNGVIKVNHMVCENIISMGKFGGSLIDTCKVIGRIQEAFESQYEETIPLISRRDEKKVLSRLSNTKVKNDKTMCDAIRKIYPQTGGGKIPSVGIKKQPGPLYGVHGDAWQALAVAITYLKKTI